MIEIIVITLEFMKFPAELPNWLEIQSLRGNKDNNRFQKKIQNILVVFGRY